MALNILNFLAPVILFVFFFILFRRASSTQQCKVDRALSLAEETNSLLREILAEMKRQSVS